MTVVGPELQDISSTLDRNFDPFTVYECSVSAATNGGVGDASETAVARTEQDGELTFNQLTAEVIRPCAPSPDGWVTMVI